MLTEHGVTPLALVGASGSLELVGDLLEAGADPNLYSPPTRTIAAHYAERFGMRPLEGALHLHQPGVLVLGWGILPGDPGFDRAEVMRARVEIGRLLLREGAIPDFTEACVLGELLLAHGADPGAVDERGRTPLECVRSSFEWRPGLREHRTTMLQAADRHSRPAPRGR